MKIVLAIFLCSITSALGCGMNWGIPRVHFDGVDEIGHVLYVEELGELNFGEDKAIPIILKFSSDYQNPFNILGSGFLLPLLEANIVQISETQFQAEMPDGWKRIFYRLNPNSNVLDEGGGWKAEIKGDIITAWASCGWKLIFKKGRITSITSPKNRTFNIAYSNDHPTAITENGKSLFKVARTSQGETEALVIGDNYLKIEIGQRPQINVIHGQNLITRFDRTLNSITLPDSSSYFYQFEANDSVEPTLQINKLLFQQGTKRHLTLHSFSWNPLDGKIINDNEWTYQISLPKIEGTANIQRTNRQKQNEKWYLDSANGIETTSDINGNTTTTINFLKGPAAGNPRKISVINSKGVLIDQVSFTYNENGKLIRKIQNDITLQYDGRSQIVREIFKSGKKIYPSKEHLYYDLN